MVQVITVHGPTITLKIDMDVTYVSFRCDVDAI